MAVGEEAAAAAVVVEDVEAASPGDTVALTEPLNPSFAAALRPLVSE